jgi:serine/threonine protein kinase
LGKYELLGELGRGAFGIVYRARDPIINRMVALKTMPDSVADNPDLLQRFYREAQSAGSLQHPNIVAIFDLGQEAGTPFIAMELVDGQNLEDFISKRVPMPVSLKLVYAVQAARAFEYAHKRGIIHRDIKPGNVMVNREGIVKVVDFGIARVLETSKTQTGTLIGTFSYMAPEVFHGEHASERSDIWSFGILLYELLSYQRPFSGGSPAALMQNICSREPIALRQVAPDCPEDLEELVQRTLRKAEADRFQNMEQLLLELEPICKRLQAETVAEMTEQGRQFMEQGDLVQARDRLRQALLVDSTNSQAKALSEKVSAELRRLSVRPRAQSHVDNGRTLLRQGKLQEASVEAENALHLDSQFKPACELQQEIQREIKRAESIRELVQSAKHRLVEGLPDEAEGLLLKIREADPSNQQLPALQQQISEERDRRQKLSHRQESMQQARVFWTQQKYRECIAILTKLLEEFPGGDEIARLLETAREDQAEQSKQEKLADARSLLAAHRYQECIAVLARLQQEFPREDEIGRLMETAREDQAEHERKQKLAEARSLLAARRFADALATLDSLLASKPDDSAVLKLRSLAQREQEMQVKSETLQREWDVLKKLVSEKAYSLALARAEELLHRFPGEPDLSRLVEFARGEQAQMENDRRFRAAREQVEAMLQANRFPEAAAAARAALESFPGSVDFTGLLAQAEARERKETVRQLIERRIREIKVKIHRGELSAAKELAQETLSTLGPDTDVHQLLSSAAAEYDAREKKRRQQETLESVRAFVRSGKLDEAATSLEGVIQSGDFDALDPRLYEVADEISAARQAAANAAGATAQIQPGTPAREYAMVEGLTQPALDASHTGLKPAMQPASTASDTHPPTPVTAPENVKSRVEITPPMVDQAARMLAYHVGPISRVLAKRAAERAENRRALYLLLAEHLPNKSDRARFLRDAGFPES